ncbi:MAG: ABC transporter permease subunit [Sedimentisphaerales bacterium]|nr:ABC transporter permease subunit [Sedimentisphaerales bacterium]
MAESLFQLVGRLSRPSVWVGPIFDKELRVSSRRKRNYFLRFGYLLCLTAFIVLVWLSSVNLQIRGPVAYQQAKMAEAGKIIIVTIVIFQFLATQFITIIMLSTSISDEIYHRTLGVLMTTPINSFQIVMGKLFSKLLQLLLLLAISLPLLAIVRVLGGVPWDYILSGLCITLTSLIFAGSMSLFFSIGGRRSYAVILTTILALSVAYAFIPGLTVWLLYYTRLQNYLIPLLAVFNPFIVMAMESQTVLQSWGGGVLPSFFWMAHCGVMLFLSSLILAWSVRIVRQAALSQAVGENPGPWKPIFHRKPSEKKPKRKTPVNVEPINDAIRDVVGSPVVWKELRAPLIQGGRHHSLIGLVLAVSALVFTYWMGWKDDLLREDNTHMSYVTIFMFMGMVCNLVLSATMLTSEKELRSWPLLLSTTLEDREILLGKAAGVFRRCLPVWLFLAVHVLLFILAGYIHPVAIVHLVLIVSWIILFLTGSGLYFSALFQRTTTAVVANMALAIVLWLVVPVVLGFLIEMADNPRPFLFYMRLHPLVQTSITMRGNGGDLNAEAPLDQLRYIWPDRKLSRIGNTNLTLLSSVVVYGGAGVFFGWRARKRLRKNIF